jgi:hypothetical protein
VVRRTDLTRCIRSNVVSGDCDQAGLTLSWRRQAMSRLELIEPSACGHSIRRPVRLVRIGQVAGRVAIVMATQDSEVSWKSPFSSSLSPLRRAFGRRLLEGWL